MPQPLATIKNKVMLTIKVIKTEAEYLKALKAVDAI